jgi:hypothetical protein
VAVSEGQRYNPQHPGPTNHPARTILLPTYQSSEAQRARAAESRVAANLAVTENRHPLQEVVQSGQCPGPRDHLRAGVQVSMSQRGPASRPASPFTARSPVSGQRTSPGSLQSGLRGGGDPPSDDGSQESASISSTTGERPQYTQRSLGVHNILNPTDHHSAASATSHSAAQRPAERDSPNLNPPSQYGSSPSAPRPFVFQGQNVPAQQQGVVGLSDARSAPAGPSAERGSPGLSQPYSALGGPRHYLTPRSPRASSMSHGPGLRGMNPQQQFSPTVASGLGRSFAGDAGPERPSHSGPGQPQAPHFAGLGLPGVSTPNNMPTLTHPPRSLSQPNPGQFGSTTQEQQAQPRGAPSHPQRAPNFPPSSPYTTSVPPANRGFPSPSTTDSRWPTYGSVTQQAPTGVKGTPVPESLMFVSGMGEDPIMVSIDRIGASRQADEKRLRNAGASARFRARKKDRDQQKEAAISKLEAQGRELEKRIRDVEAERDRYRADRDRLRDIVYRTPSIAELAYQGPPSPAPPRSTGYAENSPHVSVPPPPPIPATAYGAPDPMTGERAARRRRTDPQVEFSTPSYLGSVPQTLSYSGPMSQPGTPSSAGRTERLPPLRMDQPMGATSTTSEPGSANTPAQEYSQYKREPYESGWATKPSGPHDPGQR